MEYSIALGTVATVIGLISYVPYFRDIFRGTTKPHPFSWLAWGALTAVAFFASLAKGGGAGAWATGITAVCCFSIGVLGFQRGEKNITRLDWFCFIASIVAVALWRFVGDPLIAVVIVAIADVLAFVPTFRKSWEKPFDETILTYSLSVPKWGIGIAALQTFNLTTALFPAVIFLANALFVVMVLLRRRQLAQIPLL